MSDRTSYWAAMFTGVTACATLGMWLLIVITSVVSSEVDEFQTEAKYMKSNYNEAFDELRASDAALRKELADLRAKQYACPTCGETFTCQEVASDGR